MHGLNQRSQRPSYSEEMPELLPSQVEIFDRLARAAQVAPVVAYNHLPGMGASTMLRRLARDRGALFVDALTVSQEIRNYPGLMWQEPVYRLIKAGLEQRGTVVIDDFIDIISTMTMNRGGNYIRTLIDDLSDFAIQNDYRLVLSGFIDHSWETTSTIFGAAAAVVSSGPLALEDYQALFAPHFGIAMATAVDFKQVHRGAPMLDLKQLRAAIGLVEQRVSAGDVLNTDLVEQVIEEKIVRSNLKLSEVEELHFSSLPGAEEIARSLETHVVLPFRNKALARKLDLKPRRGVLLYGPPGTGKTSIGRALAHRMQGRFFLIDGSFITEPPGHFFSQVEAVIDQAKKFAPSVLFIDDADVLFEIPHIAGLSRYLLSLLDGIESESANNVCVMMTAMDAKKLPDALLRSGRVELWLETRLPDLSTRARILQRWTDRVLPATESIDYPILAEQTEGFTPADLRRLSGDAKLLYAADMAGNRKLCTANEYLLRATSALISTRNVMAVRIAEDAMRTRAYA